MADQATDVHDVKALLKVQRQSQTIRCEPFREVSIQESAIPASAPLHNPLWLVSPQILRHVRPRVALLPNEVESHHLRMGELLGHLVCPARDELVIGVGGTRRDAPNAGSGAEVENARAVHASHALHNRLELRRIKAAHEKLPRAVLQIEPLCPLRQCMVRLP